MLLALGLQRWSTWPDVSRNAVALSGLAVDLIPIWGVLAWGWDASALVMLYWLENVVLGGVTLLRIFFIHVGRRGFWGLVAGLWAGALFTLHYGLFSFGHGGILLEVFGAWNDIPDRDTLAGTITGMLQAATGFGAHMVWVLGALVCWHAFAFTLRDVATGELLKANPEEVAFEPYGRVIVFHIGVLFVAATLEYLGDAGIGALALVLARAAWGLWTNVRRKPSDEVAAADALATGRA